MGFNVNDWQLVEETFITTCVSRGCHGFFLRNYWFPIAHYCYAIWYQFVKFTPSNSRPDFTQMRLQEQIVTLRQILKASDAHNRPTILTSKAASIQSIKSHYSLHRSGALRKFLSLLRLLWPHSYGRVKVYGEHVENEVIFTIRVNPTVCRRGLWRTFA